MHTYDGLYASQKLTHPHFSHPYTTMSAKVYNVKTGRYVSVKSATGKRIAQSHERYLPDSVMERIAEAISCPRTAAAMLCVSKDMSKSKALRNVIAEYKSSCVVFETSFARVIGETIKRVPPVGGQNTTYRLVLKGIKASKVNYKVIWVVDFKGALVKASLDDDPFSVRNMEVLEHVGGYLKNKLVGHDIAFDMIVSGDDADESIRYIRMRSRKLREGAMPKYNKLGAFESWLHFLQVDGTSHNTYTKVPYVEFF